MSDDLFQVVEKLEKTRTLARRGATEGERAAAAAAVARLRVRLVQFRSKTVSAAKPDHYTFTMAIASLAQMRIVFKLVAEKSGRVLKFTRASGVQSGATRTASLTATVPYREDALTIQTLTEYYCDDLDEQLQVLARDFVRGATQDLRKIDSQKAARTKNLATKDLAWCFSTKHERNVFGSIARACGKESFRVASDATSVMKINASNETEAVHLSSLLNDNMRRFKRAMVSVNQGYLQAIGAAV
jgi:hypothetical protein